MNTYIVVIVVLFALSFAANMFCVLRGEIPPRTKAGIIIDAFICFVLLVWGVICLF